MSGPQANQAPPIGLPKSDSTCTVSIIDTTTDIVTPPNLLVEPPIEGHKWLNLPDYSFHIKHDKTGTEVLFDLGTRKDWINSVPHIADLLSNHIPGFRVKENVPDILTKNGVKLENQKAFILSHWHFDHSGNIASLPQSVDLIVGPGFKDEFLPGFPTKDTSPFWEEEFKGRNVIEAPFNTKIGKFDAWDYFGDGSLYVLNTPGHATGHVSALVRTTPDTAIFMGGDLCHFTGDIRPSEFVPMPDPIPSTAKLDKRIPAPCPCSVFTKCHPNQDAARTTPYYKCATGPASFYAKPEVAMASMYSLMEFDADPNILVIIAHDTAPIEVYGERFFPNGNINDWQKQGWKESTHWHFLNELPIDGKTHREPMVDGLYKWDEGAGQAKKVKDLEGNAV